MRYLTLAVFILFVGGCAPRVILSTPTMVIIDPVMIDQDPNRIQEVANKECSRYNRVAEYRRNRTSSDKAYSWPITTAQTKGARNDSIYTLHLKFFCVESNEESGATPALDWPELPQSTP